MEIPFASASLPALLHLPRGVAPQAGWPLAVYLTGMDNNKEQMVAMYGERMLERGIAVLAIDGPGQAESIVRDIPVTQSNHAGRRVGGPRLVAGAQGR